MKFCKYSGAGNTFLITDEEICPQKEIAAFAEQAAVDGVIFLQNMMMRYYNADGSEAAMCGNGLRCTIQYLWDKGIKKELYEIQTKAGVQRGRLTKEGVICYIKPPTSIRWEQKLFIDDQCYSFHYLNTSVPHAVFFVDPALVTQLGKKVRNHSYFSPEGVNANFVSLRDDNSFQIRTYERGVERETLACGTGSIASALACNKIFHAKSPLKAHVQSGEILTIGFREEKEGFIDVSLMGAAVRLMDYCL